MARPFAVTPEVERILRDESPEPQKPYEPPFDIDAIPPVHSFDCSGIQYVVDRVFALGAVSSLNGDAGSGKTTFVTALAGCVACGVEFLGRQCSQRKVLILDRENSLPVLQERISRLGVQDGSNFKIWGSHLGVEAPQPGAAAVLEWVVQCEPKPLIIVDSLIAFLEGDENDAVVMRSFMRQLRQLADLGAAVIVLHHCGKGESSRDYRGSSDFKAAIDIGYTLTNFGEGCLDRLRLKAFKTRFTVERDLILYYRDGQFVADDRPAAVGITVTERLTELLRQNPGIKGNNFQEEAAKHQLGKYRARTFLEDGVKSGAIRRVQGRNNSSHYSLAGSPGVSDDLL